MKLIIAGYCINIRRTKLDCPKPYHWFSRVYTQLPESFLTQSRLSVQLWRHPGLQSFSPSVLQSLHFSNFFILSLGKRVRLATSATYGQTVKTNIRFHFGFEVSRRTARPVPYDQEVSPDLDSALVIPHVAYR